MKNIKNGFTLVELLFVMAIIAILAGFAIANLKDSTKVATQNSVKNDAKNFIAAQNTYFAANQAYGSDCDNAVSDTDNKGLMQCYNSSTEENAFKATLSKDNFINVSNTYTDDGGQCYQVEIKNNKTNFVQSFDSCKDGTLSSNEISLG